jgi:MoaA/NifB/PqqE/SkfB family radical SAM enzyme
MEFHPSGDVQACCANALYPVGNVRRSTLAEIWDGPRVRALRDALEVGDMSLGCSVCRYRLTFGHGDLARDYYDNFPVQEPAADGRRWPYSLHFSLHNTCNLECVMCGADRSSKIRSRRTDLAPLPHAYGDAFFEQLDPFLDHAGSVDFSGGEPFMVREHQRVWDLLAARAHRPTCSVATNGTVWNETVERVLDQLDMNVAVSVDGMDATTFERIRVGASFDEVMGNVERFLAYTQERGTVMTMSWSLVRDNWTQLGAAASFCEERGINLKVQTVIEPEFGVQRLPTDELRAVVDTLAAEFDVLAPQLERNRWVVERELQRLVEELSLRSNTSLRALCMEPPGPESVPHAAAMVLDVAGRTLTTDAAAAAVDEARRDLHRWCGAAATVHVVDLAPDGTVRSAALDGLLPTGAATATLKDLLDQLAAAYGGTLWIAEEFDEGDRLVQTFWIGTPHRDVSGQPVRMVTVAEDDRLTVLLALDEGFAALHTDEVPVALAPRLDPA